MEFIQTALAQGRKSLSEYQSKQLLKAHGIPVTREILTNGVEKAVQAAVEIGYPVVLKACGAELMHKSESDALILNLKDAAEVRAAFDQIMGRRTDTGTEILVQEMIRGQRELVVGMNREPQFGPCVMLGLGGIMAEVLQDTVFRVAPFDHNEALDMLQELRSKAILGPFRGQAGVQPDELARILTAVGEIGLGYAAVQELDINPLIIDPKGRITAVDALVILKSI